MTNASQLAGGIKSTHVAQEKPGSVLTPKVVSEDHRDTGTLQRASERRTECVAVLAIDPGPTESAYLWWADGRVIGYGKQPNDVVLSRVVGGPNPFNASLVIEQVASFGMAVGAEVFETVFWSGRYAERWQGEWSRITRMQVKIALCHDSRAKDGNIRQAIIDRFGGKDAAIGKKKTPGPLYGVSGDVWSALAVALTYMDLQVAIEAHQ